MDKYVYINGSYCAPSDAKISVFDHGFLYGDGVFEGIRLYDGKIFKLKEHVSRLFESARSIALTMPYTQEQVSQAIIDTARKNSLSSGYARVICTRGIGSLGLNPFTCERSSLIIIIDKIELYPETYYRNGLNIVTVPTRRVNSDALSPQVKSLNYLNNIMGKVEALNCGVEEAIMLNAQGFVSECTGDNIFIVKKGVLLTPSVHCGILDGITRRVVIELAAKHKIMTSEHVLTRHDIYCADECFLTGTAAEIVPVVTVDKRPIGDMKPGPLTLQLICDFKKLVKEDGVSFL